MSARGPARADRAVRRGLRAAELLLALPGPDRRALPAELQADQVMVSLTHSSLFDEWALAEALQRAAWRPPGWTAWSPACWTPAGRCQIDTLQVTPRVASTTRESRLRSAWAVARRIDELLQHPVGAAPSSSRRRQTSRLISKPAQRLPEARHTLALLRHHGGRRTRDEALVAQLRFGLVISPSRRAISLARRAARPRRRSRRAARGAVSPTTATGAACVAAAKAASSSKRAPRPAWPAPAAPAQPGR
jgi:hypothetical protein